MKFVFPKNYNLRTKLFGFIDYQTAIVNGIWALILYAIANFVFSDLKYKIYFFITLYFPMLLFSVFGFGQEGLLTFVKYMITFMKTSDIYLYDKSYKVKNKVMKKSNKYMKKVVDFIFELV